MKKATFGIYLLSVSLSSIELIATAQAAALTCPFTTDTCGFGYFVDTPAPSSSAIQGGRLIMHTNGFVYEDAPPAPVSPPFDTASEIFRHGSFHLPYNVSWNMEITAKLPSSLTPSLTNGMPSNDDYYVGLGLNAGFEDGLGTLYSQSNMLLFYSDGSTVFRGINPDNIMVTNPFTPGQNLNRLANAHLASNVEEVRLGIRFDSVSKILTSYIGSLDVMAVDVDDTPTNWGMGGMDEFFIALSMEARGYGVPASTPLEFDDFEAATVPIPASIILFASSLIGLASIRCVRRQTTK